MTPVVARGFDHDSTSAQDKHKHNYGPFLTNALAQMALIVSKSSLSIRNKLQLRCYRVWMANLPPSDWLLTVIAAL